MKKNKENKIKRNEVGKTKKTEKEEEESFQNNTINNWKNNKKGKDNHHGFNKVLKTLSNKKNYKKKKKNNIPLKNEDSYKKVKETLKGNDETVKQNETKESRNDVNGHENSRRNEKDIFHYKNYNISSDDEHNFATECRKKELDHMSENEKNKEEKNKLNVEEETIYIDTEFKDNIYSNNDDDEEDGTISKNNHFNVQDKQNKVDYITYIEEIRKEKEKVENANEKVEKEKSLDKAEDENNVEKTKKEEHIFKIFLLFAPLAVTNLKHKNYLINADDHLEMFEKKKKKIEELSINENNHRRRNEFKQTIKKIENNLENIRSDVVFFTLLALRDSILNKKKKLQIYIHTINNLLIYVSPEFRVPRNFFIFKKIMATLFTRNVVYSNEGIVLLEILQNSIEHYKGDSVCVGVSNNGFPTDAKKFADKIKASDEKYSFFFSLSNLYDVTDIQKKITRHNLNKRREQELLLSPETQNNFFFDYFIRISDLPLSPVITCSKLTHFLNF